MKRVILPILLIAFIFLSGCTQKRGTITILTEPLGATVHLDGVPLKDKTPVTFDFDRDEVRTLQIGMDGYYTIEEALNWGWLHYEFAKGNGSKIRLELDGQKKRIWMVTTKRRLLEKPKN